MMATGDWPDFSLLFADFTQFSDRLLTLLHDHIGHVGQTFHILFLRISPNSLINCYCNCIITAMAELARLFPISLRISANSPISSGQLNFSWSMVTRACCHEAIFFQNLSLGVFWCLFMYRNGTKHLKNLGRRFFMTGNGFEVLASFIV